MHRTAILGSMALAVLALSGCQTPEEITTQALTHHQEICRQIGFQNDTNEMRSCIAQFEAARRYGRSGVTYRYR